jgi:hypothetical protein
VGLTTETALREARTAISQAKMDVDNILERMREASRRGNKGRTGDGRW